MNYEGRIFRPPSEAGSLIIQVTVGCSNNTCAFCGMYKDKRFHMRPLDTILEDIRNAKNLYGSVRRIFLADGDALIRNNNELLAILECIRCEFPDCDRVSCYASPKSISSKSDNDLKELYMAGIKMVYMGLESGNDEVLSFMHKGSCSSEIIEAGCRTRNSGISLSVTAIVGLGGINLWQAHAVDTGRALTAMNPEYIGLLTLMSDSYAPLHKLIETGAFIVPNPNEMLIETRLILENTDSNGSVFRMNHASNYLNLRGTLNKDKKKLLEILDGAIDGKIPLRPEYFRGL